MRHRSRPPPTRAIVSSQVTQFFTLLPASVNDVFRIFFKFILFLNFLSEFVLTQQQCTDLKNKNTQLENDLTNANQRLEK